MLDVKNQEGLAVDGALMSKDKQVNKRIQQHNPKCIPIWCCDHRANLVAKDASTDDNMETLNSVNLKVFDLVNASARIND